MSALEFARFLLLLIHILMGLKASDKRTATAFTWLISGTLQRLQRNLRVMYGFGCELQMLCPQQEEKWKL